MIEEHFIIGESLIHRMDPRARIVVAIIFSVIVAISNHFSVSIPALFLSFLFVYLARLPFRKLGLRIMVVNVFILLLWIILPFSTKGKVWFSIGPLMATKEGIIYSAMITLKSNAILLSLTALVSTVPVFTLGRAIKYLMVPDKIVHLLVFTYRYIHTIHEEYKHLINAIKIRGFRPKTNVHTYRTYASLAGILILRSLDRAERVRAAMLCRGFNGILYDLHEFSLTKKDRVITSLMLLAVFGIGVLQWLPLKY